jgi:hypothetical protein
LEKAVELVMEDGGWNSRCEPPWDEDELLRDTMPYGPARNAYQYAKKQLGAKSSIFDKYQSAFLPPPDADAEVAEAFRRADFHPMKKSETGPRWSMADVFQNMGKLFARAIHHDTIIEEWLPDQGLTIVRALRGTGKTVFLIDMAMHIACDMPWQGNATQKGWNILYFAGEDDYGAQEMMEAWCMKHGVRPSEGRFTFVPKIMRLLQEGDVEEALKLLRPLIKGPTIIILDTWQRAISGSDKNEGRDMQTAIDNAVYFAEQFGGPVMGAFHPPKQNANTTAGAAEQENSSHAIIHIAKASVGIKAVVERIKGERAGAELVFTLEKQQINKMTKHGKPRSSIYVNRIAGSESTANIVAGNKVIPTVAPGSLNWDRAVAWFMRGLVQLNYDIKSLKKLREAIKDICDHEHEDHAKGLLVKLKESGIESPRAWCSGSNHEIENMWNRHKGTGGFDLTPTLRFVPIKGKRADSIGFDFTNLVPAMMPEEDGGMDMPEEVDPLMKELL